MATISLRSAADIERVFQEAIDDIESLRGAFVEVDPELVEIKIHLTGPRFQGSLTTSVMVGLIELQKMIYNIYLATKPDGHRLTNEEKHRLELVAVVKEGSLDLNVPLDAVLKGMTGDQVLVGVAIVAVAWVAANLGKVITEKVAEVKLEKIREKRELANNDTQRQLYQTFENMMAIAVDKKAEVTKKLIQADPASIQVGGAAIDKQVLADNVAQTRRRIEPVTRLEEDDYIVEALHFDREGGTFGDLLNTRTGEQLRGVNMQEGHLSESEFALIREAEKKNPVRLGVIVERRDGVYRFAYLNNVVQPSQG